MGIQIRYFSSGIVAVCAFRQSGARFVCPRNDCHTVLHARARLLTAGASRSFHLHLEAARFVAIVAASDPLGPSAWAPLSTFTTAVYIVVPSPLLIALGLQL